MTAAPSTLGLIVPSSNTVMERDLHRQLNGRWVVGTTRILLEQVTRLDETAMIRDELPRALRLIATMAPSVVVFGCTSAGSLGGLAHDAAVGRAIEDATGAAAVTVVGAVVAQLRRLAPTRVGVFTPYGLDLTRSVADCVTEAGYDVAVANGMGMVNNRDIGRVTPDEIVSFVGSRLGSVDVDCLFLSCTNWQAVEAIEPLGARFGVPVITSNQASIDAVRAAVG